MPAPDRFCYAAGIGVEGDGRESVFAVPYFTHKEESGEDPRHVAPRRVWVHEYNLCRRCLQTRLYENIAPGAKEAPPSHAILSKLLYEHHMP